MSLKNYSVRSVDTFVIKDWILRKHYAKRMPSISYCFELLNENNLTVGVCSFGKPASPSLCIGVCGEQNNKYVYELNRLITNDDLPKNATSFFVSKCLKMLPPLIIVSYADIGQNHIGFIYQATNFLFTGTTKERTDIGFENSTHSRHYDKNLDYKANRKKRTSKNRYIYFTGSKKQNKKWLKELNYKIQPYPKGQNKNYDASYEPTIQTKLF